MAKKKPSRPRPALDKAKERRVRESRNRAAKSRENDRKKNQGG